MSQNCDLRNLGNNRGSIHSAADNGFTILGLLGFFQPLPERRFFDTPMHKADKVKYNEGSWEFPAHRLLVPNRLSSVSAHPTVANTMSSQAFYGGGPGQSQQYYPPQGPPGQGGYPQQPQQVYQGGPGYPGQPGYAPQPQPQVVYVQQGRKDSGGGTCTACLAGLLCCCCAEELCDICF